MASYTGKSEKTDVTPASAGTDYSSSNPAIATVSADGLVTAVANGTVLITAFNEGTSGSVQIVVGIPPQVSITSPLGGAVVTQGSTIPITAQITSAAQVASVSFSVNGRIEFTTVSAPFIYNFTVPTGVSTFTLSATVRDVTNVSATSAPVAISAIPDPLTTVTGSVVDPNNAVVSGAAVNCAGVTGTTSPSGTFSIAAVPTARGNIVCFASSGFLSGSSAAVAPVLSGTTNVGKFALSALSSRGTDFWLGFQLYYLGNSAQVFIMTETSANYTVSSTGFNVTGSVTSQAPATVAIPNSLQITANQTIEAKGIHITSDAPITATVFYPQAATNDTYLAIPTALLGTEYLANAYQANCCGPSEFVILGTQATTSVTIIPACQSSSGTAKGSTLTVSLGVGQSYQYLCNSGDITGSQITSDKPIGVIAGVSCVDVPTGSVACDILSEMMFPVGSLYGTDYFSAPFPGSGYDLFRVIAARDNTSITFDDGVTPTTFTLNRGAFREFQTKKASHVTSNKPISVLQFAVGNSIAGIGDPAMMQLIPTSAFRSSSRFYSPSGFAQGNSAIIIAPNAAVTGVALNGVPVSGFKALPGGTHQYAVVSVVTAQSVVTSSLPVGVYAIGFTAYGSYAHPTTF